MSLNYNASNTSFFPSSFCLDKPKLKHQTELGIIHWRCQWGFLWDDFTLVKVCLSNNSPSSAITVLLVGNHWVFCKVSWSSVHHWLFLFRCRRVCLQTVPCGQCAGCTSPHTLALQCPGIVDAITALSVFLIIPSCAHWFFPCVILCYLFIYLFFNSFSIIIPGGRHVLNHRTHPLSYDTLHLVGSPSLCPSGSLSLGHPFRSLTAQST